jgi:hypothetical protein
MQTHDNANSRFSKTKVEEFWRLVDSIKWENGRNAESVKTDLMKLVSSTTAETNKRIAVFYALQLVDAFRQWHASTQATERYDAVDLEFAASNAVGGGKFNYNQFIAEPRCLASEISNTSIEDNFLKCLPSEDDYYAVVS